MSSDAAARPEFRIRLPHGGPTARGRLLAERGANGSQQFLVSKGSPARADVVPSFPIRMRSSFDLRQRLIDEGAIVESTTWPGSLETSRDITCNSPSAAAEILVGRSSNGFKEWKTEDGRPLSDFVAATRSGPSHTWLIRGSNVTGVDLVRRLWLPESRVSVAAGRLRPDVGPEISKDQLRSYIDDDYESTATYGQKVQLVEEFHTFLSRMKPGDTVCTITGGELYVGEVTGPAEQVASEDGRSNLRRPVEWQQIGYPYEDLPEELQQKLSIQHDVVDLTSVAALVAGLGRSE